MASRKPRRYLLLFFFNVTRWIIYPLPFRVSLYCGALIGGVAFRFLKRQRDTALSNLKFAFPSIPYKDRLRIARESFRNLGKAFVEIICLPKITKNGIERYIAIKGLEKVEPLVQAKRGGIVLSAHFGNWELLAHYFALRGYSVNVIARRMRMNYLERFLQRLRNRNGVSIIYRDASAKEVLSLLKNGEFVGIMPDQDMDAVSGEFVDFFGKPAYTPAGPALLHILTGASIIPCFIIRKARGHEIVVDEFIKIPLSGDRKRDIHNLVSIYTKIIEDYIRRFPEQWVWMHNRWKTRPDAGL